MLFPSSHRLQTAVEGAAPRARRAVSAVVDRYHAANATLRSREINRLCTACQTIPFEHRDNSLRRTGNSETFIWPIDHVIVQRDSCHFCHLIFEALSTELNDPLKADPIKDFIQDDLKNLGFRGWAESKYNWMYRAVRRSDNWPFGCSRDPPETRESVREIIASSKEELKHLETSNDMAMMMAAGAAVSQTTRLSSGNKDTAKLAEAAEGLMWTTTLYNSLNGNRLPCWIVGSASPGSIKIEVCARGREPRARLRVIRTFNVLLLANNVDNTRQRRTGNSPWHYGREVLDPIDLSLAGTLLSACTRDHNTSCGTDTFGTSSTTDISSPRIRLISIENACLREFRPHRPPPFVALSYVWGNTCRKKKSCRKDCRKKDSCRKDWRGEDCGGNYCRGEDCREEDERLEQKNRTTLYRSGVFDRIKCPETIVAGMKITKSLGRDFLGVDGYCVVQDDENDKKHQLNRMDVIYRRADITIVAADYLQTALSGITGVTEDTDRKKRKEKREEERKTKREEERKPKTGEEIERERRQYEKDGEEIERQIYGHISDSSELSGLIPMSVDQDLSTWESRGWTFQEKVMSHRLLVFSEGYMVWHCRGCTAREDMTVEDAGTDQVKSLLQPAFRHLEKPDPYSILPLTEKGVYRRSKTFKIYADLVKQYTGRELKYEKDILSAFTGITNHLSHAFNSPFHYGLPENVLDAAFLWKPPSETCSLSRRDGFPSWSWTGWSGNVLYDKPFEIRTNADGALVRALRDEGDERLRPLIFIYKVLRKSTTIASVGLLQPLAEAEKIPHDWEARYLPEGHEIRIEASLEKCTMWITDQMLCFESTTAAFVLSTVEPCNTPFRVDGGPDMDVMETWHVIEGKPRLASIRNQSQKNVTRTAGWAKIHEDTHWAGHRCEFLVLSEAHFHGNESRIDALGYTLYNVLAFRRVYQNGEISVIERIGTGRVEKYEWDIAKPRREVFLLQ